MTGPGAHEGPESPSGDRPGLPGWSMSFTHSSSRLSGGAAANPASASAYDSNTIDIEYIVERES